MCKGSCWTTSSLTFDILILPKLKDIKQYLTLICISLITHKIYNLSILIGRRCIFLCVNGSCFFSWPWEWYYAKNCVSDCPSPQGPWDPGTHTLGPPEPGSPRVSPGCSHKTESPDIKLGPRMYRGSPWKTLALWSVAGGECKSGTYWKKEGGGQERNEI